MEEFKCEALLKLVFTIHQRNVNNKKNRLPKIVSNFNKNKLHSLCWNEIGR